MANLDLFNAFWKRSEQEDAWRGYATTVRKTRPFSLEDDFADVVGQLAVGKPHDLRKYLVSARLPYPEMWIEADYQAGFGRIKHDVRDDDRAFWLTNEAPERVGWLLVQTPNGPITCTRLARVKDPITGDLGECMMYPITYMFSADHRMNVDGQTFRSLEGTVDAEVLRALRSWNRTPLSLASPWGWDGRAIHGAMTKEETEAVTHDFRASPLHETCVALIEPRAIQRLMSPRMEETESLYDRTMSLLMAGHNDQYGDVAYLVSALSVMNEVPVRYVPFRPSGSIRAGGRLRPYMKSSIVTIEAPATRRRIKDIKDRLKQAAKEHAIRARHEVRGHWRHTYKLPRSAADTHRWEPWVDQRGRPGWRTWIEHHMRGSGQEGFVQQVYEVKHGQGTIPVPEPRAPTLERALHLNLT